MTESQTLVPTTLDGSNDRIHLSHPDVGPAEEQAVLAALRSGWVAPAGPDLNAFEVEMGQRAGVSRAVGLSSGTAGLHLGLLALGVQPGDVVITTTLTFVATANAIMYSRSEEHTSELQSRGHLV